MKTILSLVFIVNLSTPLLMFSARALPSDQDALQGTWQATALIDRGTIEYPDRVAQLKLKIKGDHYTYDLGDRSFTASFTIDSSKTPKEIDVTFWEGPETGKLMRGIYTIEGDTLKICSALSGRPKEFSSNTEEQSSLFTFQRDLPSKDITSTEMLSYGIYQGEPLTDTLGKTNAGNPVEIVTLQLLESTQTIPAKLGIRFGYKFVVHGNPKGKQVKLRMVFLTPPITDEITRKTLTQDEVEGQVGLEDSENVGAYCRLDKQSDLVPGTWIIQVFDHEKKLLEKVFTMVKP